MTRFLRIGLAVTALVGIVGVGIVFALVYVAAREWARSNKGLWEWVTTDSAVTVGITAGFVAALAVVATALLAVAFARWQLEAMRRTSYAQVRMTLEEIWDSEPYIDARHRIDTVVQRGGLVKTLEDASVNAERDYFVLTRVPDFFERMAMLVEDGYIRQDEVERYFASAIVYYYDVFKDYLAIARRDPGDQEVWVYFEKAAKRLKEKATETGTRRHASSPPKAPG